jgi:hypothetical protein
MGGGEEKGGREKVAGATFSLDYPSEFDFLSSLPASPR